ncbi:MAG: PKD domain-containing protein [Bacteroidetes bacterium]|nr:PKD domain-containing protein [Bacteroidota bacterium]
MFPYPALRSFLLTCTLLLAFTWGGRSQCTPVIIGPDVVRGSQSGVTYSTPGIPGHQYSWSVTGGTIIGPSNGSSISVTFDPALNPAFKGTVSLTDTEPATGCSASVSESITIMPLLVAYLYFTNESCYGDELSFFGDVSLHENPVTYFWIFGDGGTANVANPTHTYLPPYDVSYEVRLITTDALGYMDTIYDYVYVNPDQFIPTADFDVATATCLYDPVQFTDLSHGSALDPVLIHWTWNFGDGSPLVEIHSPPATNGNTSHVYATAGTYNVTLTVTSEHYCTRTYSELLTISPSLPTSVYDYSFPVCEGAPVFFNDSSYTPPTTSIAQYQWLFNDGTPPLPPIIPPASPDVNHTFPGLGPYNVALIVINNLGCRDTLIRPVSLEPAPRTGFVASVACIGDTVNFTNQTSLNGGTDITGYQWDFGEPSSPFNTSTLENPSHIYAAVGIYNVTLIATNFAGCSDTTIKQVEVHDIPGVEFTPVGPIVSNPVHFQIDPLITPLNIIGNNLIWNFGDGSYGYQTNPVHTYYAPGTYDVILTVTDTFGCSNSVMHSLTIPANPTAFFTFTSPTCLTDSVYFTDLSFVNTPPFGYITRWVWNYGDGSDNDTIYFPDDPNVAHLYSAPGNYTVTLQVMDNFGYLDSYNASLEILPDPIANFYFTQACEKMQVCFTDASFPNGGGNIVSWYWDFDDPGSGVNNTSTAQDPCHTFAYGDSTYYVTLIIVNFNNCNDTITKPVYVYPAPVANFTADTVCLGEGMQFTDLTVSDSGLVIQWDWDFGDGTPHSTIQNPIHFYASPGIYFVKLTVATEFSCIHDTTLPVMVVPLPFANFNASTPTCSGQEVFFTDHSSTAYGYIFRWIWDYGDGDRDTIWYPTPQNTSHVYAAGGNYNATLYVLTTDSCESSTVNPITITFSPIANFSYSSDTCQGKIIQFNDLTQPNGGTAITSWAWNFDDPPSGGSNVSNLQNPTHLFSSFGTYDVTLITASSVGCKDTIIKTVIINEAPAANFVADTACLADGTQFTDLSIPNAFAIIAWDWDFGDGTPHANVQDPLHLYTLAGTYNVTLTVTNSNNCTHSITKPVLVIPQPATNFLISAPTCAGTAVNFTDISTTQHGFIVRWIWNFGDGNSQTINFPAPQNTSHTYAAGGNYAVTLTVKTSDSCEAFVTKVITITPAPLANFTYSTNNCQGQVVQFTDLSQLNGGTAIATWSWTFGDLGSGASNYSNLQNPVHLFTGFGNYNVQLIVTSASGCKDTTEILVPINQAPFADFEADTACLGTQTTFTDQSIPNAANIISWNWDFGDGTPAAIVQNPVHIYVSPGLYTVTLTIVNSNNCTSFTSKQVRVLPLPTAQFSFSSPTCSGSAVFFSDLSTTSFGFIDRWIWNFGDGNSQTINYPTPQNTSHVYAAPGNYNVTLTVRTSDSCYSAVVHQVTVTAAPLANFTNSSTTCEGQQVQFTDLSQAGGGSPVIFWNWNFGDFASGGSNFSTLQNPTHIFSGPGNYTVTLIITSSIGCKDTVQKSININEQPTADFSADTACLGSPTTFQDLSVPNSGTIQGWSWNFGDGSPVSNVQNPTHTYTSQGTYNVTLTVTTSFNCTNSITKPVMVLPEAMAAFGTSSAKCSQAPVQFTDMSSTSHGYIYRWVWNFGDGNTQSVTFPNNPDVTHTYANPGTFNVTLTITTSDSCHADVTNPVTVTPSPMANFQFSNNACPTIPVQFTDQSQPNGGTPVTLWDWNFDDLASGANNTSTLQNPQHAFTASGTYDVQLIATNTTGCKDTIVKVVTVNDAPVAGFTADTACFGSPTTFTDASTSPAGSIITWDWDFGDGTPHSNLQNPTHLYAQPGTYNVTLVVSNSGNCVGDTTIAVVVKESPTANFSYENTCVESVTQFTDLSTTPTGGVVAWAWDFGDGGTSTAQNPTHTYTTAGLYDVILIATNSDNCNDTVTLPVEIFNRPTADFGYTGYYCPAGQVQFQNLSIPNGSPITTFYWEFQPGYTATVPNPVYVFPVTDTCYSVSLIVTDANGCSDTAVKDSVCVLPGFEFTVDYDTVCFGTPTHLSAVNLAAGDSLYFVRWNFSDPASGGANTSFLHNPTHTFTAPGTYPVKLVAWNSNNCVDSIFMDVIVRGLPIVDFDALSTPCLDFVEFTDLTVGSGNISEWEWTFGDGSPSVIINPPSTPNVSHLYAAAGVYNVKLRVTNEYGCSDSLTQPVERLACIVAAFAEADTIFCDNLPIFFNDNSTPADTITTWHWDWGDGQDTIYTTYAPAVTHRFNNPGTYTIKLTITALLSSAISDSMTQDITIHPAPTTYFTNPGACLNTFNQFTDTSWSNGALITRWNWTFGEPSSGTNDTSTLQNPSHIYATPGIYEVKLLTTNGFGCKDSLTKTTKVHNLPIAEFQADLACDGNPTQFTDMSQAADTTISTWAWNFGVASSVLDTSNLQNPTYRYYGPGDYLVAFRAGDRNGCTDTASRTVTVYPTPVSSFSFLENIDGMTGKVQFNNLSQNANYFYWDFGNNETSELENPIVSYENDGTYLISLISYNNYDCSDSTFFKYTVLFKGLYIPNAFAPASTSVNVRQFKPIGINLTKYKIEVFNGWGHLLWSSTALDTEGKPIESWDGKYEGVLQPQDTYFWKASGVFKDNSNWEGNRIGGKGDGKTMGTVTLIR